MNPYQKAGTFIARIVGAIAAFVGLMGPIHISLSKALGQEVPEYTAERWLGSLLWGICGVIVILAAKPLGQLAGRGLQ